MKKKILLVGFVGVLFVLVVVFILISVNTASTQKHKHFWDTVDRNLTS